jgi:hypothetical protein
MQEIKLTFDRKTRLVKKEVSGFSGSTCQKATEFIDLAIGRVVETELKSEYHIPNPEGLDVQAKVYN